MSTELEEKAAIYFFLSRLFREAPDRSLLIEIIEKKLLTLAAHFFEEGVCENNFLEEPEWLGKLEEIAVEHTTLFIMAGEPYIPPYESYYCDALSIDTSTAESPFFVAEPFPQGMKGFIGGPSAVEVEKFYAESGFVLNSDFHDLPDHIACELELMGRLYREGKVEEAQDFFQNHLGRWVFTFLERLEKQKHSLFYPKVAVSLKQFLKQDGSVLLLKTEGGSKND